MNDPIRGESLHQGNKLLGLEIIRFASAISVLIWHYQNFFYVADKPADFVRDKQPYSALLSLCYNYGYLGVQVFWCISGFIFFWKYSDRISSNAITYKNFFVLRFSRLYPLHFVALILVLVLQTIYFSKNGYFFVYQNNDFASFLLQLFLASDWGPELRKYSFNGPIWSISVEVLIYCCFFVILKKISKSWLINIAVLALCLAAKYFKFTSPICDCMAFFYIGGLSSITYKRIHRARHKELFFRLCLLLLLVAPVIAWFISVSLNRFSPILFLLLYVPTLLFFSAQRVSASSAVKGMIEAAGNMTYSSYLIHFPLQLLTAIYCSYIGRAIPYYSHAFFIGFISITLIAAYFIYRFFELPAQIYIRRKLLTTSLRPTE